MTDQIHHSRGSKTLQDVLIVGSGPAGLSAAIYTSRAGLSTRILTGGMSGGLVTTTDVIDNYLGLPSMAGADMANVFKRHATEFGAELVEDIATEITYVEKTDYSLPYFKVRTGSGALMLAGSVIYAAGSTPRKLGVQGEELEGVSYCATCDGTFSEGEPVAVVGGGESAVEEALYLSRLASSVDVFVRGDKWRAGLPAVAQLTAQPNVRIHMSTSISEIRGDGAVEQILLNNGEVLDMFSVFVSIGQNPNSQVCGNHVKKSDDGFIESSLTPGFFVAGDIANPAYRQVVVAAGEGAKAGIDATAWLLSQV